MNSSCKPGPQERTGLPAALNNSERMGAASAESLGLTPLRWNIALNLSGVFIFASQAAPGARAQ